MKPTFIVVVLTYIVGCSTVTPDPLPCPPRPILSPISQELQILSPISQELQLQTPIEVLEIVTENQIRLKAYAKKLEVRACAKKLEVRAYEP
jgi:hypothetical protein